MPQPHRISPDGGFMRLALRLAKRGYGTTSPNPMVGAVLVRGEGVIGRGWHQFTGGPHAEIEAIADAQRRGHSIRGATLYVTLEPCCTYGRTPPCTEAIIQSGIKRVVAAAMDPNPKHSGRAFYKLRRAGISVRHGLMSEEATRLNEAFNHWIVHRTPFVTVKAGMTLDGKIATASGESKWISSKQAREYGQYLRAGADAILVGVNTIVTDNPRLTRRPVPPLNRNLNLPTSHFLRRIILDPTARTELSANVVSDAHASTTTIVVGERARRKHIAALQKKVRVLVAPVSAGKFDLRWLLKQLGSEEVTSLLVEGGGETNAGFLLGHLAQRIVFFYATKIIGGRDARHAVGGGGATNLAEALNLRDVEWQRLGPDLLLLARIEEEKDLILPRSKRERRRRF